MFKSSRVLLAACAVLTICWSAHAQPSFSVEFQGPPKGVPDTFPPAIPITEGDILVASTPPAPFLPAPGPLPVPGTIILAGPPGGAPPHLGLPAYAGPIAGTGVPDFVEVDALSFGLDWLLRPGAPFPEVWTFSVDEFAVGVGPLVAFPPTVATQAAPPLFEAAADIYSSFPPGAMPLGPVPPGAVPLPGNGLLFDGNGLAPPGGSLLGPLNGLGLVEPLPPVPGIPVGGEPGSNLDALDVDMAPVPPPAGMFVYFSLDAPYPDPIEGPPVNSGSSAANLAGGGGAINFKPLGAAGGFGVYAFPPALGLDIFGPDTDDLDALAIAENGCVGFQAAPIYGWGPCGGICPCALGDMVFFSVRRGSAVIGLLDSLQGLPISPGDILVPPPPGAPPGTPPGIFIAAENLGLATIRAGFAANDDLDALDVSPDCNSNSVPDFHDIAFGLTPDLNGNGVPDPCECICGDTICSPICGENTCSCGVDCGTPPASEVSGSTCGDGVDNDCDGPSDCGDPDCATDPLCSGCGNGTCDTGENSCNCPADCGLPPPEGFGPTCIDGIDNDCDTFIDCADPGCAGNPACLCGDGTCAPPENPCTCAPDCGPPVVSEIGLCGDGIDNDCDGPIDCADTDCVGNPLCMCGDGICSGPVENPCNCPGDCGPVAIVETGRCADGIDNDCDGPIDCADPDCATDPACGCGDGVCAPPENPCSCPADCGPPAISEAGLCADGIDNDCDGLTDCADMDCAATPVCGCGNGTCAPPESPCTCGIDCGPVAFSEVPGTTCGDGIDNDCDGPVDCADPDCATDPNCLCGDTVCLPGEICTCPADCGPPAASETPGTNCTDGLDNDCDARIDCADLDCAADPDCLCGDGSCSSGEDPCNCPADCGAPSGEVAGANCTDMIDNDCDGLTDCADPGCTNDPTCPCCYGDVNNDGDIDQNDILIVGNCVDCSGPQIAECDVNCDGMIDLLDFGDELCLLYFPPDQCCALPHGACTDTNLAQGCVEVPEDVCTLLNGDYQGDGVDCPPGTGDCNGNGIGDGCEAQCTSDQDCDDMDVCTCNKCLCGVCTSQPIQYGDVNCDCIPPNLDDILCVLQGFSNYASCPASDIHPPCTGQGVINIDDILAVLQAFAGTNPCFGLCNVACPTGACCDGSSCTITTSYTCIDGGDVFQGDGTACPPLEPNQCP